MYQYDLFDKEQVKLRAQEFRSQVQARLKGELLEEEFRPLRLMNGLYLQLHAYMLRVAVPYGMVSSKQMRALADIADKYDKGYGHITTRQNIQYNWIQLQEMPDLLDDLAAVNMHGIQTSGNCIRNISSDVFAGAALDEHVDPRPVAEWLRQWSSFHPEFTFLPRKFKIAVTGASEDRAALALHDIGIRLEGDANDIRATIMIGGGQGRTPMLAKTLVEAVPLNELLIWLEAIMRVYNLYGRRDNLYKARIKILVHEKGIEQILKDVLLEMDKLPKDDLRLTDAEWQRVVKRFVMPVFDKQAQPLKASDIKDAGLARFLKNNSQAHKQHGYRSLMISLKSVGEIPGDISSEQMRQIADCAETLAHDDIRFTHRQNIVLPHVRETDIPKIYAKLVKIGLATANYGMVGDIISCPGLDYCNLATARSIPVAQELSERFKNHALQDELGQVMVNISGCINACGHHHVGGIGILGLEKKGVEFYQITIGGDPTNNAKLGQRVGAGFSREDVGGVVEAILSTWKSLRNEAETLPNTYSRVGIEPFKQAIYDTP